MSQNPRGSPSGFWPSQERGEALDTDMRARLAGSLDHIFDRLGPDLKIGPAEAARATAAIRARRQSPQLFGAYFDLAVAVDNEDIDRARNRAREVVERVDRPRGERWVAALDDRPAEESERCRRLLLPAEIVADEPDPQLFDSADGRIADAMALLDRGFPDMAAEIRALLAEVVVAAGPEDPKALTFDGSSSYMMWGAVMLNARGQTNVLDTAQALAHESGHNLLFGKCSAGWLIENDDEELFASPLRTDPRPMDGIFHAAYVIARMHQTLVELLRTDVLTPEESERARADLALHRKNFDAADEVIRAHGRLTELGKRTIEEARAHFAAVAA